MEERQKALTYQKELAKHGLKALIKAQHSTSWQIRVCSKSVGRTLTKTFESKSVAQDWVRPPAEGEVQVPTLHTGASRGPEMLVFAGKVTRSEWQRMRAPFQQGDFSGPLKYGYVNVGGVVAGAPEWLGRTVLSLPTPNTFVVPVSAVVQLPPDVPAARAVLTANLETAINALRASHCSIYVDLARALCTRLPKRVLTVWRTATD